MASMAKPSGYLGGQLLVAMPQMPDPRFARSVVYLCAHTADGAMGLIVNKLIDSLSFPDLLRQLNIDPPDIADRIHVHFGGPVEAARGFVLHSTDYMHDATMVVDDRFALTATIDVLKAIAKGSGPRQRLLALGYAGWAPGQLDQEINSNGWLTVPADPEIVFGDDIGSAWQRAIAGIGVDLSKLASSAGHA
jgi:putative transcriptional regulator